MDNKKDVSTPSKHHSELMRKIHPIRSLMGGTLKMRDMGKQYLPQEPGETSKEYENRLERSFLYNYFARTVGVLAGKPFSKPIMKPENQPELIEDFCYNVDLMGNDLTTFFKQVFLDSLLTGVSYVLVDYPTINEEALSVVDEAYLGIRPYLVHVKSDDVLGWKSANINGKHVLTQIRIRRYITIPEDDYNEKEVEQILVFNLIDVGRVGYEFHQEIEGSNGSKEWVKIKEGELVGIEEIPIVPYYTYQTGFFTAEPPLLDLAHLQLSHWQKQSDFDNLIHVIQVPILFGKGWDEKRGNQSMQVGTNRFWKTSGTEADLKYVEHSGQAAKVGAEAILKLEDQMMKIGIRLIAERNPGGTTATEASFDAEAAESALKSMAKDLTSSLNSVMDIVYLWFQIDRPSDQRYEVNDDFGAMFGNDYIANWLLKANLSGVITKKTVGEEAKRIGYLNENIDVEEEIDLAAEESMSSLPVIEDEDAPE